MTQHHPIAIDRRTRSALAVLGLVLATSGLLASMSGEAAVAPGPVAVPTTSLPTNVVILCFHDLSDDPKAPMLTVSPATLRAKIREAKAGGWTFLRMSELLARLDRGEELPARVIALTFDDGYRSFRNLALPILRDEQVPASLAIVSAFVDAPPADVPPLMSWNEIVEVERSGLVEIASHSYDMHRWATNNPYRDTAPAMTTRLYLTDQSRYETRDEYRERIRRDMTAAQRTLREKLGHPVPVFVWPYGEHNEMARALAAEAGFRLTLTLGDRAARAEDLHTRTLPRIPVTRKGTLPLDAIGINGPAPAQVRAVQVDIDPIFDPDVTRFRSNLDAVVARVRAAGATHAILQACPDPEGNGKLTEAYFMNHQIPVKADVWSAVAAKLRHAGLRIWVRAPTLNLSWAYQSHPEWRIQRKFWMRPRHKGWYYRISPDLPETRKAAIDFYADLAVYLPIDGVLFDDDAYMLPNEKLRGSGSTDPRAKSDAMREMIGEIMHTVRAWRPEAEFGRNIYATAAEHDGLYPMFAQDLDDYLRDYDLTFVMAYAQMEEHGDAPGPWVNRLVSKTLERWTAGGIAPVLFKLQAYDWAERRWLTDAELVDQAAEARKAGAVHLGVYPVMPTDGALPRELFNPAPAAASILSPGTVVR